MPLPTQPLARVLQVVRAFYRSSFPGFGMGTRQFLGQLSRAVGNVSWSSQKGIEDVDNDIVPSTQSSSDSLAAWAFLLGLPNGQGGYGLLGSTAAAGGIGNLTGVKGTVYPQGAIATAPDGQTQIELVAEVTIPGTAPGLGSVSGNFTAVTLGSIGNIEFGTTMTWEDAPAGSDPTFVLTAGLGGAIDGETSAGVFGRILARLQNPPRGGTSADYTEWAEMVSTITGVYIFGRRSGTGTIDVVLTLDSSGLGRVPPPATITAASSMIDTLCPVHVDGVNVMAPFTAAAGHVIRVRVVPNGLVNAFDWGSDVNWVGTPLTVDLYTPGVPATLRLNTLAPQSLKAAIAAYIGGTGPQPRLQVLSTGGQAINVAVGTSPTVTWSDSGGKTTITLDTLPSAWTAPSTGDVVYPYGPTVAPIALAELALVDGLGPSRASGYADTLTTWQDTLSINQISRVAENAVDSTGAVLVTEVIAGGATIDGSSASDLEASDAIPSQAPEILYCAHVAVTP